MIIKDLFQRDVERPIDGVIKADDVNQLDVEMDEFVLTGEIEKQIERFLEEYNDYGHHNGVWISGFFGSGKSHLLKIISLLLENHDFGGRSALSLFLDKCKGNPMLQGSLRKACSIPSKSILFNIDQKSDTMSKSKTDTLLAVFVKVFDEMCGYYGKQAYIAQFERDLDSRGLYGKFRDAYSDIAGKPWETGREQALLEKVGIRKAYARITGEDENALGDILKEYSDKYKLSIEDFAELVHAYILKQGKDFRLNFFVDEIGQYIANNTKLMLNLQTIAESLNTKCRGRAWIIVTSQMDIKSVVGDVSKTQANDFSKIMARFMPMQLTGQTVDEVIEKRLLDKKAAVRSSMDELYARESGNFKTIFGFTDGTRISDGTRTYKEYRDAGHFTSAYPFVPYQFELFQQVMFELSKHNAFQGKYTSVGARSMLSVFQQVAKQLGDAQIGTLARFDLMFDGIRTILVEQIQRDILFAENNLPDKFAVQVLKTLFFVKYVKGFNATIRNLCVLLLSRFGEDMNELKGKIEVALGLLEGQTYIQRDGDVYEFLTDEEKDIEQEIKDTLIDADDLLKELERMVFDNVLRNPKIRHTNGQDYAFARKLDDHLFGRDQELAINIITPYNDSCGSTAALEAENITRKELLVIMALDDRLARDLTLYKQTEKYIRQSNAINTQDSVRLILEAKRRQNEDRRSRLQSLVQEQLVKARYFVKGSQLELNGDAAARLTRGFQELVSRVYPNLRMLGSTVFSEKDIPHYLREQSLLQNLTEAEAEIVAVIGHDRKVGVRTTLKRLLENFSISPYGWSQTAVLCLIARIHAHGKLEIRNNSELLEGDKLASALTNSNLQDRLLFELMEDVDPGQLAKLKELYKDLFHDPASAREARELARETSEAISKLDAELSAYLAQANELPFLASVAPVREKLKKCLNQTYHWYLGEFLRDADDLVEARENILDPIRDFMAGRQKEIYLDARTFLRVHAGNLGDAEKEKAAELKGLLDDKNCYRGRKMQRVRELVEELKSIVEARCKEARQKANTHVQVLFDKLKKLPEYDTLPAETRHRLQEEVAAFGASVNGESSLASIRGVTQAFEEDKYPQLLAVVTSASTQASGGETKPEPAPQIIRIKDARIDYDQVLLSTADDVENYVASVRNALLRVVQEGKRIQL